MLPTQLAYADLWFERSRSIEASSPQVERESFDTYWRMLRGFALNHSCCDFNLRIESSPRRRGDPCSLDPRLHHHMDRLAPPFVGSRLRRNGRWDGVMSCSTEQASLSCHRRGCLRAARQPQAHRQHPGHRNRSHLSRPGWSRSGSQPRCDRRDARTEGSGGRQCPAP